MDKLKEMAQIRLWEEVMSRRKMAAIPHILLALVAFCVCHDMQLKTPASFFSQFFILLGCFLRWIVFIKTKPGTPTRPTRLAYCFSLGILSFGWGLFYIFVQNFYGPWSAHSSFAFLVIAGFSSGGVTTLGAYPKGYLFFLLPMTLIPAIYVALRSEDFALVITFCIVVFDCFHIAQIVVANKFLKRSIHNELDQQWQREKFETLINAVPGFVTFISDQLIYLTINDFGKKYYPEEKMLGQRVGFLHPNSDYATFVHEFMASKKETQTTELKIDFMGEHSYFIVSIKRIFEPMGGAVIVSIPIDELVTARHFVKTQEAQAQYTAKLVSLGQMAGGIAHEINNPLAIIQASTDQTARQLNSPVPSIEKLRQYNEKIQKTIDRISMIIKSLKGLSRNGDKDPYVPFKFQTILEPCLEVSRQRFKDDEVKLTIDECNPDLRILGQEISLCQVLMNILNNAFDAAMENDAPRWVRVFINETETTVDICVQDSGKGIPPEIRAKIMEPFFTTKAINKGTGLGLSISKSIMDQHGGALIIADQHPHTTFIMRVKKAL